MKQQKDYSKSRFQKHIRIDERQLGQIKAAKGRYCQAGFLDMVINHYWRCLVAQKEVKKRIASKF